MKRAITILAIVVGCAWGGWYVFRATRYPKHLNARASAEPADAPTEALPGWHRRPGYVGSDACGKCHEDQFETFLETAHSRALTGVSPEQEPPDAVFDHLASGRRYRIRREDGNLVHAESLLLDDGTEFGQSSFPLRYRVGSGHFGRTYLCEISGFLVESPVTWYEPRREWGMSPGYDAPMHQSFSRVVPENCLLCHAGLIESSAESDFRMRLVENSIGCERCHGPGEAHLKEHASGRMAARATNHSIVNPRNLSRKLTEAICQQCHLQGDIHVEGRGGHSADFRPGLPLERFRTEFRMRRPESGMTIVGHFEQMRQSACYRRSETLTCVTCHDPHAPVSPAERTGHYRSVCMTCHAERGCKLPLLNRQEKSDNDCVRCHMPQAPTEVPHVAFTHHHIGVHPLEKDPSAAGESDSLIPLSDISALSESDRKRSLLLASLYLYLRLGPDANRTPMGQELSRRIDELLRDLPREAVDPAVEVARAEYALARENLKAAAQFANSALESDDAIADETARALFVMGSIEFRRNQFEQARLHFEKMTRLRRNARDWYSLGLCENNCGNVESAIGALKTSLEIDPASTGSWEALAAIYHARKEFNAEKRVRTEIARLKQWESERGQVPRGSH